ncbi:TonB-dependent receptor domain-containing protein [Sediminibacterium ginsengisoli]|nr:TonB-dependent receptor [Sediminibacterium ginsengisoli]
MTLRMLLLFAIIGASYTILSAQSANTDSLRLKEKDTLSAKQALDEVTVKSRQQVIEAGTTAGTIIYHVARSADAIGQTALETLKRAPGVAVNNNTVISLNGRTGVTVMIDGRVSFLSGREIIDMLQSMPSSSIRSIELISSPGAKYDASGTAGIIHIRTIKMQGTGLNGNMNTGVSIGVTPKQNTDLSFNYRRNRWNYMLAYNHFIGHYTYDYGSDRYQNGRYYNSSTFDRDKRLRFNSRAGVDYSIDEKQTLGLMFSANFIPGGGKTETDTKISGLNTTTVEQVLDAVNDYYRQNTARYNVNLNYQYEDKGGRQLNIDVDYGDFSKENANLQSNIYADHSGSLLNQNHYRTLNNIDIRLFAVKADYAQPLWKGKLEFGGKYSSISSENNGRFYHIVSYDSLDNRRSNRFAFTESIASAYASYSRSSGKWNWQLGLRMEHTANNSDTMQRRYTHLFPSGNVSYALSKRQSLSLSYSRRIDRPAYPDLNPFMYMLDELSYWQGNPYLQPQLSHRIGLQWVNGSRTVISLNYTSTASYIARITDTTANNSIMMIPRNIGRQNSWALVAAQGVAATPWWDLNLNVTFTYLHNDINFAAYKDLQAKQFAARFNFVQRFKLAPTWNAEVTAIYNSGRLNAANERTKAISQVDLALVKNLSSACTIRIAMNDIYKGNKLLTTQDMGGYYIQTYGYYETQQFRMNLSYRFASKNSKAPRNRSSALEAENGRIR